ncbi:Phage (Mu-like) virion morphogenesis protein [Thermodesulfovibrio sp. N1]|nr:MULTISPECIES: phage minor head protein [unclassified Thermodesulfovibrio]MDI1471914.1 phage minor head protein [Thermodesulfovibrio sp. 1176]ODA43622.1 Phage (Mu-like) virion morphogenesis protein [Thermodesulfovibrio sp. N1]
MPESIDLAYAIGLPPEKAIEYFKAKGYKLTWDWWEMWQEAHAKAFTVAKAMRMDILQDIREMVQKAINEGISLEQFRKELEPRLKAKGWWGYKFAVYPDGRVERFLEGSPWRLKTIFNVNMQTAYMAGRYKTMMESTDTHPYWQYVAVLDSRTRPAHRALHGKIFRYDDPFWKTHYPPNGFNCRCRVRALSQKDIDRKGLPVDSAEGKITWKDELVSKKTGELQPVAVYHDPVTGMEIPTDVGWGHNPGLAAWFPDMSKYTDDLKAKFYKDYPYFSFIKNKKLRDFLQAEVEKCNEEARIIIEKYKFTAKYISTSETSRYNPLTKTIFINSNSKKQGDFIHEFGHHLDELFKIKIEKEFVYHFREAQKLFSNIDFIPELRPRELYYGDPDVSCFFEGLTRQKIYGSYGHKKGYYLDAPDRDIKEAIASLFALWARNDRSALNFIRKQGHCFFVVQEFEKIMKKILMG